MNARISKHAIQRYQERVAPVTDDEAKARLSSKAIQLAATFGARCLRLGTGQRVILKGPYVVTVLAPTYRAHRAKYR